MNSVEKLLEEIVYTNGVVMRDRINCLKMD